MKTTMAAKAATNGIMLVIWGDILSAAWMLYWYLRRAANTVEASIVTMGSLPAERDMAKAIHPWPMPVPSVQDCV